MSEPQRRSKASVVLALSALWPNGIPPADYARLVDIVETMRAAPPEVTVTMAPTAERPSKRLSRAMRDRDRVRQILSAGPRTMASMAEELGTDIATIRNHMRVLGVEVANKRARTWKLKG